MATNNKVNNNENMNPLTTLFANLANVGINITAGASHREIFKKEIISSLPDKEAKTFRRKIRKLMLAYAESLVNAPNNKAILNQFNELYKQVYSVNDYTISSVCSDNMKEANKNILIKALDIAKKAYGNKQ